MRRWLIRAGVAIAVTMSDYRRGPLHFLGRFPYGFAYRISQRLLDGQWVVDCSKASSVNGGEAAGCRALGNRKWPRYAVDIVVCQRSKLRPASFRAASWCWGETMGMD